MFSFEFSEISNNAFFTEYLWATASAFCFPKVVFNFIFVSLVTMALHYPTCLLLSLISPIDYWITYLSLKIVFAVRLESFWPSLAVILGLWNVLDKLSLCCSKLCKRLIPKKYSYFTIWAWTPIILPLISESNFASREMAFTEFIVIQLPRMLFKVFARTVHLVGKRAQDILLKGYLESFEAFLLFFGNILISFDNLLVIFFYHVIYC